MKVVNIKAEVTIEDVVEWLRAHNKDKNIDKLSVVFENKDGTVYSKSINLKRKDYVYFLMSELNDLFNGED